MSTPTSQPTPAEDIPPAPPTAQASPAGVENYGASTPRINDGFDDPSSGWGVGVNEGGGVQYADGSLLVVVSGSGAWECTTALTGSTDNAVSIETLWMQTGGGMTGLLCANSNDELWGATEDSQGNYAFIKLGADGATVLQQGQLDAFKSASDGWSRFSLDCAGTATGSFRMQIHPAGTNTGVQYFAPIDEGPRNFDRVGIYAESSADSYSVSADSVLAFGGTGDTSMSPEAKDLMTHIPATWQPNCFESFASAFATGATADILCQPNEGRSDWAEYISFDTQANMDAYFQYLVNKWAVPETGVNCDTGAHQGGYSISGQHAGQVLCAPSITGTQFDWTTDDLLIEAQLIDLKGSYPDMYQDWLEAGPN